MSNFLTSAFAAAEADLLVSASLNIATTGLQSGRSTDDTNGGGGYVLGTANQWMRVTLTLASIAFGTNPYVSLYLIPCNTDATPTWPDYTTGQNQASPLIPPSYLRQVIPFNNATRAQSQTVNFWIGDIANAAWRPVLVNNCGVAWATTGNSCKYRTFSDSI